MTEMTCPICKATWELEGRHIYKLMICDGCVVAWQEMELQKELAQRKAMALLEEEERQKETQKQQRRRLQRQSELKHQRERLKQRKILPSDELLAKAVGEYLDSRSEHHLKEINEKWRKLQKERQEALDIANQENYKRLGGDTALMDVRRWFDKMDRRNHENPD